MKNSGLSKKVALLFVSLSLFLGGCYYYPYRNQPVQPSRGAGHFDPPGTRYNENEGRVRYYDPILKRTVVIENEDEQRQVNAEREEQIRRDNDFSERQRRAYEEAERNRRWGAEQIRRIERSR
ncbi:hypothetical protein FJZ19_04510 [Candidatus Pacearchaeota archaeon]|nr:hypothetical protein [Candidatus Pacearchaeota archaeon]